MKKIYKIAKAELALLFYSPVAWLILLVFTFQIGLVAVNITEQVIRGMEQGYRSAFLTNTLLAGRDSIFVTMAQYLYLYMPLLTMGLMSREYASGTIKLLYSA
ncbi:ABC transporter permease, partial [Bacteroides xylanisolvens]|uniref:ABC transporter permease n=3 Tax=Bacteroides TaxID=816 RepID=UPI003D179B71